MKKLHRNVDQMRGGHRAEEMKSAQQLKASHTLIWSPLSALGPWVREANSEWIRWGWGVWGYGGQLQAPNRSVSNMFLWDQPIFLSFILMNAFSILQAYIVRNENETSSFSSNSNSSPFLNFFFFLLFYCLNRHLLATLLRAPAHSCIHPIMWRQHSVNNQIKSQWKNEE